MDHRCIHCHFLAKKVIKNGTSEIEVVNRTDRQKMQSQACELAGVDSFHCFKKVWDERTDLGVKDRAENFIHKNRRGQCFFYPYKPNLTFDGADYLQQNTPQPPANGPSLLGDRAWLIWGLSAVVLIVSIVIVLFVS